MRTILLQQAFLLAPMLLAFSGCVLQPDFSDNQVSVQVSKESSGDKDSQSAHQSDSQEVLNQDGRVPHPIAAGYVETGIASWYGKKFHKRTTASGEIYNMYEKTAAHKTLPFFSVVEVVHLENKRKVIVRINDRGPFIDGRIIDLSYHAAQELGMVEQGIALIRLRVLSVPSDAVTLSKKR